MDKNFNRALALRMEFLPSEVRAPGPTETTTPSLSFFCADEGSNTPPCNKTPNISFTRKTGNEICSKESFTGSLGLLNSALHQHTVQERDQTFCCGRLPCIEEKGQTVKKYYQNFDFMKIHFIQPKAAGRQNVL